MELGSADAASAALLLPLYLAPLLAVGPQRLCSCAGGSPPTELTGERVAFVRTERALNGSERHRL